MIIAEARTILGLTAEEDPLPHLEEFRATRERMAQMVRSAPNEILALRYQDDLIEFDQALAAVREHLERESRQRAETIRTAADPSHFSAAHAKAFAAAEEQDARRRKSSRRNLFACLLLLALLLAGGGGWLYLKQESEQARQREAHVDSLRQQGAKLLADRRWQDAAQIYQLIERLEPHSPIAQQGRRSIQKGLLEEDQQFRSYWEETAHAAIDSRRWEDAEFAAQQLRERFPDQASTAALIERIAQARLDEMRLAAIAEVRKTLEERRWDDAFHAAQEILQAYPDAEDAQLLLQDASAAREKAAADQLKARDLFRQAAALNDGQFHQEALDWLREADQLDPGNPEIRSLLDTMSSYSRTLRVPEDFPTPAEALLHSRDKDRIVIAAGTWQGPLIVNAPVELEGSGHADCIIQCPAEQGSPIVLGPAAKGARISGFTFRHESFDPSSDRYSVALVRGGQVTFTSCHFNDASGHGLVVMEGGHAIVNHSRFFRNGWNGIAVIGAGSLLEARDSESLENFGHGVESWDRASLILTNNRCEGNSRDGVHADNGASAVTIENNRLQANREFGLVLSSASSGRIKGNLARENLLGGFVIRTAAANVAFAENETARNQGPGLILEKGLSPDNYQNNSHQQNRGDDLLADFVFSEEADEKNLPPPSPPMPPPASEPE